MVDLLACAGCLEEAENIMKQCPVKPHVAALGATGVSTRKFKE
jgi:hypothetical protein